ncbi:MAG TPA: hypothetical protein VFI29_07905 [Hanamia sp.]|nr:hypothetical protein [Hanamia sp.]
MIEKVDETYQTIKNVNAIEIKEEEESFLVEKKDFKGWSFYFQ